MDHTPGIPRPSRPQLVGAEAKGQEIVSEEAPPQATNVIDLMEVLKRSVQQICKAASIPPPDGERASDSGPVGRRMTGRTRRRRRKAGKTSRSS
ncbi:hypothetical protein B7755_001755 [Streptomyces sp. NBS 14/10]|uniref:hypothetical protein n=1 Tax=Streptomyces sp. NBS 14/10 TaxID=1945643 RepID=UPI00117C8139|nr:hypothetical protein [Streptomyces sp. NBS 14/10]KAK1177004.1 hypothetical protein B7755_001755 [Streptomyces sp. NBS 14/10]